MYYKLKEGGLRGRFEKVMLYDKGERNGDYLLVAESFGEEGGAALWL